MSSEIFQAKPAAKLSLLLLCLLTVCAGGCAVAAKTEDKTASVKANEQQSLSAAASSETKNSIGKGRIKISPDSPAEAVRTFYKKLREKRFREAMLMTNVRLAVEGLSEAEMEDLRSDFEPLAHQVPAEIEINGEIITNNLATVTAKMPNEETGALELKEFRLRREDDKWLILTADEAAENVVRKEGKKYFFMLRVDTHHAEAREMMGRIAKAQMVYALQNRGFFTDMQTLIAQGLLPDDIQSPVSTGYRYTVLLSPDRKRHAATAEPAVYGKTGKLSFILEFNEKEQKTHLKSDDNKGAPLKTKKL